MPRTLLGRLPEPSAYLFDRSIFETLAEKPAAEKPLRPPPVPLPAAQPPRFSLPP